MKVDKKLQLLELVVELLNSKGIIEEMLVDQKAKLKSMEQHDGIIVANNGIILEDGYGYLSKIDNNFNVLISSIKEFSDKMKD
jgi:hypothetical protein